MKKLNHLKNLDLLMKGVSETIKDEAKKQKGEFLGMLLGALAANLFGIY